MAKMFILYDERARMTLDTDEASVLVTAASEREAKKYKGDFPSDSIWVEYDVDKDGKTLLNENFRWDISV